MERRAAMSAGTGASADAGAANIGDGAVREKRAKGPRVLVIGGGAAGLTAAVCAARAGADVVLAERMDRVGKKLLATGGGRCNLSNSSIELQNYHGAGAGPAFSILERGYGFSFTRGFFLSLGVPTALEDETRLYPRTFLASTVLDALRAELARLGVSELCGREALSVTRRGGRFAVRFRGGAMIAADRVVVATGGKASPVFGSNGGGYALFLPFGHRLAEPAPALTQLRLAPQGIRGLKGVRLRAGIALLPTPPPGAPRTQNVSGATRASGPAKATETLGASGASGPAELYRENGELLFTDYGVSGIPALNLSLRLAPYGVEAESGSGGKSGTGGVYSGGNPATGSDGHASGSGVGGGHASGGGRVMGVASVDLFPEYTNRELAQLLSEQATARPGAPLAEILGGFLHKRVAALILAKVSCPLPRTPQSQPSLAEPNGAVGSDAVLRRLAAILKDWRHEITGTMGFDSAQVTYGGLLFEDFDTATLESKKAPGLYAAGEILDVAGDCGGYNLQWAWASGHLAGSSAAAV